MTPDSAAPLPCRLPPGPARTTRRQRLSALALFLAPFLCGAASAQNGTEAQPDDVVRVRTDLVTVPALVTDADGRRVRGLTQSDFSVRDNGRAVTLSYFAAGTDRVALAFALDSSGSIRELVTRQRDAA